MKVPTHQPLKQRVLEMTIDDLGVELGGMVRIKPVRRSRLHSDISDPYLDGVRSWLLLDGDFLAFLSPSLVLATKLS